LLRGTIGGENPLKVEWDTKGGHIGAGCREVGEAGITKEDRASRRRKGDGEVIGGPRECSKGVALRRAALVPLERVTER
jgi:hypothetical protein